MTAIFFPVVFIQSSWNGHYIKQKGIDTLQQKQYIFRPPVLSIFHSAQHGEPGRYAQHHWTAIPNPDIFSRQYFKSVADFLA